MESKAELVKMAAKSAKNASKGAGKALLWIVGSVFCIQKAVSSSYEAGQHQMASNWSNWAHDNYDELNMKNTNDISDTNEE